MDERVTSLSTELHKESRRFAQNFLKISAAGMSALSLIFFFFSFFMPEGNYIGIATAIGMGVNGTAYWMAHTGRERTGALIFLLGMFVNATGAIFAQVTAASLLNLVPIQMLLIGIAAFLLDRRELLVLAGLSVLVILGMAFAQYQLVDMTMIELLTGALMALTIVPLQTFTLLLFIGHNKSNLEALDGFARDIERVVLQAEAIAAGDLSGDVEGDGRASGVIRSMLDSLRKMVTEIRRTVGSLASATSEIAAMARQQEHGAVEQASAVQEVQQTLAQLAKASGNLAESAQEVHRTAEKTRLTNEVIAERIGVLSTHTRRIGELLEIIKGVANKSEILALNASLEGAKAGEAGRGFSLVAAQMQRLAESVMDSVSDVKNITRDIRESTQETVISTEEGTKLASAATEVAREISAITEHQRMSTEQVTHAMDDIASVARQVSTGSSQTLAAARDLSTISEQLGELVGSFKLEEAAA